MGALVEYNYILVMIHGQLYWPILGSVREEKPVADWKTNAYKKKTQLECAPWVLCATLMACSANAFGRCDLWFLLWFVFVCESQLSDLQVLSLCSSKPSQHLYNSAQCYSTFHARSACRGPGSTLASSRQNAFLRQPTPEEKLNAHKLALVLGSGSMQDLSAAAKPQIVAGDPFGQPADASKKVESTWCETVGAVLWHKHACTSHTPQRMDAQS